VDHQKKPREIFTKEQKRVQAELRTEQVFAEVEAERCARVFKTLRLREARLAMETGPRQVA
jgi:hypothetical protein